MNFKGRIFVTTGLQKSKMVERVIEDRGGIIKSSTGLKTNYVIYGTTDTAKYKKAVELNAERGLNIELISEEEFFEQAFNLEEDTTCILCHVDGSQADIWIQEMDIRYLNLPYEAVKQYFELANRADGNYEVEEPDVSYCALSNLADEMKVMHKKMLSEMKPGLSYAKVELDAPEDGFYVNENLRCRRQILKDEVERYKAVAEIIEEYENYPFDYFAPLNTIGQKTMYWIDQTRVEKEEYLELKYNASRYYQECFVLFKGSSLPVNINDPDFISVFNTGLSEALYVLNR